MDQPGNLSALVRMILEQEGFFTKDEEPIEFKIIEQQPSDSKNRGWVLHEVKAYIDGEEVGYLKISYIPHENMESDYANIVQYVDRMGGRSFHVNKPEYKRADGEWVHFSDQLDDMRLEDQVLGLNSMIGEWTPGDSLSQTIGSMSEEDILDRKEELLAALHRKHGKAYTNFKSYFSDKPVVDYIRVKEESQRKGIGAALYETGARWLAKKGMKLYASGLQSDMAKGAWVWLAKNKSANIGREKADDKVRIFLSYL